MNTFETNLVTHFPSQTLGTLFRNVTNKSDPNIYVIFSGHVCRTDCINATFLTFLNTTVNAKILNVNIWIDVAIACIQDPTQIPFAVTTQFAPDPILKNTQDVSYFSNYQINNSLALLITSNIRDPYYRYPQEILHFFYPESFLLREAQGVAGVSGSPIIDLNQQVIGIVSKIIGQKSDASMPNMPDNLVCVKSSMFYYYLFDSNNGLITKFYKYFTEYPTVNDNFNLLVNFRNSFNIVINHLGFYFRSYKDMTSSALMNLDPSVNGIVLSYRITGVDKVTYSLTNYLQKNDPDIENFMSLLDYSDILNDFYKNKAFVLIKTITFTTRTGDQRTLDLGQDSIAPYYVNGDPSKQVTLTYTVNSPSGPGGVNMTFGPIKTLTITPNLVADSDGSFRYTSQLPKVFTSTTSRANSIIIGNLYNMNMNMRPYLFNYAMKYL